MKILVAGAGIAGMATGLALAAPGRQIRLIDRDPPPPDGDMDAVFSGWDRKGATQLRHSHVFLARLFTLIRDRYPDLLAALMAAGARELRFADTLPPPLRGRYTPRPGDADLSILSCRRSTLEAVMRAYTARQPGISFADGVLVRDLRLARPAQGVPCARALEVELPGGGRETWEADIIVDASGRRSCFPDWLAREGIRPDREETDAGIVYFTGHYRLRPGQGEPDRAKATHPAAADLGFLKYAVFPADGGNFSVTLAVPEGESELRALLVRPRTFDAVCAALPGVAQWTAPERAEAHGPIHTMGNLQNSWTHWLRGGVHSCPVPRRYIARNGRSACAGQILRGADRGRIAPLFRFSGPPGQGGSTPKGRRTAPRPRHAQLRRGCAEPRRPWRRASAAQCHARLPHDRPARRQFQKSRHHGPPALDLGTAEARQAPPLSRLLGP